MTLKDAILILPVVHERKTMNAPSEETKNVIPVLGMNLVDIGMVAVHLTNAAGNMKETARMIQTACQD